MKIENYTQEIEIPEGIQVQQEDGIFTFKGPKGEVKKDYTSSRMSFDIKDNKIILFVKVATKREKTLVATMAAHLRNCIRGVQEGFHYKLAICSGHFPMTVAFSNGELVIKNFLGEKVPRKVNVPQGVDVKVDGKNIEVSGIDKELVGNAASRIEHSTVRPGFDKRRFQDGIYITEKNGKVM